MHVASQISPLIVIGLQVNGEKEKYISGHCDLQLSLVVFRSHKGPENIWQSSKFLPPIFIKR